MAVNRSTGANHDRLSFGPAFCPKICDHTRPAGNVEGSLLQRCRSATTGRFRKAGWPTAFRWNLEYGGLKPATVARLEALGEQLDGGKIKVRRQRVDDRPIAGTRLIREYQGVEHSVTVLADGFEYQGRPFKSLSAIARAVTGTRWNGWMFFGIRHSGAGQ